MEDLIFLSNWKLQNFNYKGIIRMKCYTWHNGFLSEGIEVKSQKENPFIFLGEKGPKSLYQVIKLDKRNMPFIQGGMLKYAFPTKRQHITSDGLKMERLYLANPFKSKDKSLVRILTSTSLNKSKKNGRWFRMNSVELVIRGNKYLFPSSVSRGRGISESLSTTWVDELITLPHGTSVKIVPEGSNRSDEIVLCNIHGSLFSISFDEFDSSGFDELSKMSKEEYDKEDFSIGSEPSSNSESKVDEPEKEASDRDFDEEVSRILNQMDDDVDDNLGLSASPEEEKIDNSSLLHKADGSPVL